VSTSISQFEQLVRDYLAGRIDWDTVHQYAVQMEYENKAHFGPGSDVLEELHSTFLTADQNDDEQFRASRDEIAALVARLDAPR